MSSFANQLEYATAPTSSSGVINSCNAICRISRLSAEEQDLRRSAIAWNPFHYRFHEVRQQVFTVQSGVSNVQLVLSGITGLVDHVYIAVRGVSPVRENQYAITQISSFQLLDGSSTSLTGGQVIKDSQARLLLGKYYTRSSYLAEPAYVYVYAFSLAPANSFTKGVDLGKRKFVGNETLQITFTSTLASQVQVDVLAHTWSIYEISSTYTKKLSLA
jgi:hypothetical protein